MNLKKTRSHLAMLEKKHAQTDTDICELQARAGFCATEAKKLKAKKLRLKEAIQAVRTKLAVAESTRTTAAEPAIGSAQDDSEEVPVNKKSLELHSSDSQQHESVGAAAAA